MPSQRIRAWQTELVYCNDANPGEVSRKTKTVDHQVDLHLAGARDVVVPRLHTRFQLGDRVADVQVLLLLSSSSSSRTRPACSFKTPPMDWRGGRVVGEDRRQVRVRGHPGPCLEVEPNLLKRRVSREIGTVELRQATVQKQRPGREQSSEVRAVAPDRRQNQTGFRIDPLDDPVPPPADPHPFEILGPQPPGVFPILRLLKVRDQVRHRVAILPRRPPRKIDPGRLVANPGKR